MSVLTGPLDLLGCLFAISRLSPLLKYQIAYALFTANNYAKIFF